MNSLIKTIQKVIKKKFKNLKFVKNKKAKNIGRDGENKVIYEIDSFLTKYKGELLNNVILQSKNFSTQIDHIIVGNNRTIIVIETKNYKGLISGNINNNYWYQNLSNGSFKFKNPIIQNNGHINSIKNILKWNGIYNYNIVNLVVFTNRCTLSNNIENVIHLDNLENTINKHLTLSKNNAEDISYIIKTKGFVNNKKATKNHLNYIKRFN